MTSKWASRPTAPKSEQQISKLVRYPAIDVQLVGTDGNAFAVISKVCLALRRYGVSDNEVIEFREEAMSGDYSHLLRTVMSWVEVK